MRFKPYCPTVSYSQKINRAYHQTLTDDAAGRVGAAVLSPRPVRSRFRRMEPVPVRSQFFFQGRDQEGWNRVSSGPIVNFEGWDRGGWGRMPSGSIVYSRMGPSPVRFCTKYCSKGPVPSRCFLSRTGLGPGPGSGPGPGPDPVPFQFLCLRVPSYPVLSCPALLLRDKVQA